MLFIATAFADEVIKVAKKCPGNTGTKHRMKAILFCLFLNGLAVRAQEEER